MWLFVSPLTHMLSAAGRSCNTSEKPFTEPPVSFQFRLGMHRNEFSNSYTKTFNLFDGHFCKMYLEQQQYLKMIALEYIGCVKYAHLHFRN